MAGHELPSLLETTVKGVIRNRDPHEYVSHLVEDIYETAERVQNSQLHDSVYDTTEAAHLLLKFQVAAAMSHGNHDRSREIEMAFENIKTIILTGDSSLRDRLVVGSFYDLNWHRMEYPSEDLEFVSELLDSITSDVPDTQAEWTASITSDVPDTQAEWTASLPSCIYGALRCNTHDPFLPPSGEIDKAGRK